MATTARGTQPFAPPATQNTAPVHEYRCLYTHDLRKKAKKWHDGSARFHTFNKRVMVYDDTKNYIGDLHYRDDEEFGEGIELRLDRGVLVEVGERLGETQTDLTGIINKAHTESGGCVPASNAVPRPVQRVNILNSQGRPKSLSELLGTSQGKSGRVRMPVTSPYEQRHVLPNTHDDSPPLKKRRVAMGKENVLPSKSINLPPQLMMEKSARSSTTALSPISHHSIVPINPRHKASEPLHHQRAVIDISSEEDVTAEQRKPSRPRSGKTNPAAQSSITVSAGKHSEIGACQVIPTKQPNQQSLMTQKEMSIPTASHSEGPSPSLRNLTTTSVSSLKPVMSSLKMKSQQPRRKLMYKALLPSSVVSEEVVLTAPTTREELGLDSVKKKCPPNEVTNPGVVFDVADLVLEVGPDETYQTSNEHVSHPRDTQETPQKTSQRLQPVFDSPLFVSQNSVMRSPTPENTIIEEDFLFPLTQETPFRTFSHNAVNASRPAEEDHMDIEEPESPCFPPPPPARSNISVRAVPMLLPPPPDPPNQPLVPNPISLSRDTPSPTKTRSLARSLSANDSPFPQDPRTSSQHIILQPISELPSTSRSLHTPSVAPQPSTILPLPLPLPQPRAQAQLHLQNHSHSPNLTTSPPKSPIHRSKSDTAAIVPTKIALQASAQTSTSAPSVNEQGPWTGLEAFLLFEKWPTCKQKNKPVFEHVTGLGEEQEHDDNDGIDCIDVETVRAPQAVHPVLIRSAKSVWRDG